MEAGMNGHANGRVTHRNSHCKCRDFRHRGSRQVANKSAKLRERKHEISGENLRIIVTEEKGREESNCSLRCLLGLKEGLGRGRSMDEIQR